MKTRELLDYFRDKKSSYLLLCGKRWEFYMLISSCSPTSPPRAFFTENKNFCEMNFPDSQKFLYFQHNSDSDSSLTDENIQKYSKITTFWGFPWFFAMCHVFIENRILGRLLTERIASKIIGESVFHGKWITFVRWIFRILKKYFVSSLIPTATVRWLTKI